MQGQHCINKPGQYAAVYEKGKTWVVGLLVMKAVPNGLLLSRYGFTISRRVGKAVARNRVRRVLSEIMRRILLKPGWDIVFIARPAAAGAGYMDVKKSVFDLLSRARLLADEYEEVGSGVN